MKNIIQHQKTQTLEIIPLTTKEYENNVILKAKITRSNKNVSTFILKGVRTK